MIFVHSQSFDLMEKEMLSRQCTILRLAVIETNVKDGLSKAYATTHHSSHGRTTLSHSVLRSVGS